jgi:heptosyltransferase-2
MQEQVILPTRTNQSRMTGPPASSAGGFLVIRGGALGDLVLSLPALRLLRAAYPGCRIEVLGTAGFVELAVHLGLADAVRRLEDPGLAHFFVPGAELDPRWCGYFASFGVVISHLFDPAGCFHQNLHRAGVGRILRGPHRPQEGGPHASEQLAAPLAELSVSVSSDQLAQPLIPEASRAVDPVIALHPGSGGPRKNWALENWARVAAVLHRRTGAHFLVLAGEAEIPILPKFQSLLEAGGVPYDLADRLPLAALAGRLARCRLFLGHDSGPAHLAAACGVPGVVLFGPTDPAVWAPVGPQVHVLRGTGDSLAAIDPRHVVEAAVALWNPPYRESNASANSSAG